MSNRASEVSIVKSEYNNIWDHLPQAIKMAGSINLNGQKKVVIKINLCDARTPETGAITHPIFLDAVLRYLRENFNDIDIYVVESDATVVIADKFIKWFGFIPVLQKWGANWVNLSKEECRTVAIKGLHLKEVPLPRIFEDSYFITLPKLKTNVMSSITVCLKNQFGCLPLVQKSIYHPVLDKVIADANMVYHPDFCIVDGIIAMAGTHGPTYGTPIHSKLIICGKDPVAVDSVSSKIMGFNPWFVGHIKKSAANGVGNMKSYIRGENLKSIRLDFEVCKWEMILLKTAGFLAKKVQKGMRLGWKRR